MTTEASIFVCASDFNGSQAATAKAVDAVAEALSVLARSEERIRAAGVFIGRSWIRFRGRARANIRTKRNASRCLLPAPNLKPPVTIAGRRSEPCSMRSQELWRRLSLYWISSRDAQDSEQMASQPRHGLFGLPSLALSPASPLRPVLLPNLPLHDPISYPQENGAGRADASGSKWAKMGGDGRRALRRIYFVKSARCFSGRVFVTVSRNDKRI
ncbi:hypothetical protein [Methylocystis sp. ATCC 49242]|uniref:hypothetical protein n=1 Tax=Methylocystis sp. ATCC 49242 TaxID=622637 RepID=UPI0001F88852|nr:hypothetical protein [Methylocystis sp. ATCC 49242]